MFGRYPLLKLNINFNIYNYVSSNRTLQNVLGDQCNLSKIVCNFIQNKTCAISNITYARFFSKTSTLLNMSSSQRYEQRKPLPNRMKGVLVEKFGTAEELRIRYDLPLPISKLEELEPKQILIRVMVAGVNPVDTYIRSGQYARLPNLPYIPGIDAAGYIDAVGPEVPKSDFPLGSRVFVTGPGKNSGCYAEYVTVGMDYVFPLDERLSFAQGAGLGAPYFTAYKALMLGAKAKENETVLIHGASGAVGTAAVQIARSLGTTIFGTAGSEEGMDIVAKCGAHHVFNHHEKGYDKEMKERTNNEGFDVIIENLANVNLEKDMQMLKRSARIMVVGSRGSITINPRHLMAPEASIQGIALATTTEKQYQEIGSAIIKGVTSGWVNPVVHREYSFDETQQAHYDVINSKGARGKLVLNLS